MEILENKTEWQAYFRHNWLAEAHETGKANWKVYQHPRNEEAPGVPGVDLAKSRLMLISSAGAYLRDKQQPFEDTGLFGDYSLRTFPSSTPFSALAYEHGHYNQEMVERDAQVGLPLRHLEDLVAAGRLGELAPSVISFAGYMPDSARVVDDVVPRVLAIAQAEKVQGALLAPM